MKGGEKGIRLKRLKRSTTMGDASRGSLGETSLDIPLSREDSHYDEVLFGYL
jgi:hypothetical protein